MDHKITLRAWIVLALFSFLLAGCLSGAGGTNQLVGKWEHKEPVSGISVILEFTTDKIRFSSAGVEAAETSYIYVDTDTIKYRNLETGADIETSYAITGDKLAIAFYGENKVEYTKVK